MHLIMDDNNANEWIFGEKKNNSPLFIIHT